MTDSSKLPGSYLQEQNTRITELVQPLTTLPKTVVFNQPHKSIVVKFLTDLVQPGLFQKRPHRSLINSFIQQVILFLPIFKTSQIQMSRELKCSPPIYHMSHVRCQVSGVTCNFFLQSDKASWLRISYQWGLPCLFIYSVTYITNKNLM